MANSIYYKFKNALMKGTYNLGVTPPLYMALVSNSYTPDLQAHQYVNALSHVVTPSNYTAYFKMSDPQAIPAAEKGYLIASNISIYNITLGTSIRAGVIFGSSGLGVASDPLVAYLDFGADYSVTAGTLSINFSGTGVFFLT